jgi:microsomal dipeptidase-like Zn-dependent dipeptidase
LGASAGVTTTRVAECRMSVRLAPLLAKGYSEADVNKILGGNILRMMQAVQKARP